MKVHTNGEVLIFFGCIFIVEIVTGLLLALPINLLSINLPPWTALLFTPLMMIFGLWGGTILFNQIQRLVNK